MYLYSQSKTLCSIRFLDKILLFSTFSKCGLGSHWMPYFFNCGYCDASYTVIGRLEDMEQDLQFIQQMAGFKFGKRNLKEEEKNENHDEKTNSLTKMFIDQLDKKQFDQVYELFKVDFEMFGYDPVF